MDNNLITLNGSSKERYERILHESYTLMTGQAKVRSARYTVDNTVSQSWRAILLTQSERSIKEEAEALRISRTTGSSVRLIDIPAFSTGRTVFDRLPFAGSAMIASGHQAAAKKLYDACKNNHGAALERYILFLILLGGELPRHVQQHSEYFIKLVADDTDTILVRDLAAKCGLAYAGAMLGIAADVLPWSPSLGLEAAKACFLQARELLPDDSAILREGIRALSKNLRELPIRRPSGYGDHNPMRGYRFRKLGMSRCYVKVRIFSSWFANPTQRRLVEVWLVDQGRIDLAISRTPGTANAQPREQFDWPDGQRTRSYCISWPASVHRLDLSA